MYIYVYVYMCMYMQMLDKIYVCIHISVYRPGVFSGIHFLISHARSWSCHAVVQRSGSAKAVCCYSLSLLVQVMLITESVDG